MLNFTGKINASVILAANFTINATIKESLLLNLTGKSYCYSTNKTCIGKINPDVILPVGFTIN